MPCAGEEPITSYFRRIPLAGMLKGSSSSGRPGVKRRLSTDIPNPPSKKSKNQTKPVIHDTLHSINTPTGSRPVKSSRRGKPRGNSDSGQRDSYLPTPSTVPRSRKLVPEHHLQTPPPNGPKRASRAQSSWNAQSTPLPPTPLGEPSLNLTGSLPTPLTVTRRDGPRLLNKPRPAVPSTLLGSPSSSGNLNQTPASISALELLPKEIIVQNERGSEFTGAAAESYSKDPFITSVSQVPSSQAQEIEIECIQLIGVSSQPSVTPPSSEPPSDSGRASPGRDIFPAESSGFAEHDECQFIESSQSQHMLPYHISPRRNRRGTNSFLTATPSLDSNMGQWAEVIQSSQSQIEKELDTEVSKYHPGVMGSRVLPDGADAHTDDEVEGKPCPFNLNDLPKLPHPNIRHLSSPHSSAARLPQRTLSDDLFPILIRHFNTGDDIRPTRNDELPSVDANADDSHTEDESENDDDMSRSRMQVGANRLFPHSTSSGSLDTDEDELDDLTECEQSLPHTVKNFRDMFGESGGSYPDDFSMSLR